jgi:DNA-binding response OmpR family regulator
LAQRGFISAGINNLPLRDKLKRMNKKILVLDDDADILDLLSFLLLQEGYEIRPSRDGENIWDTIKEFAPDLVLMDLMLANLDGRSICRAIKENPATQHIPVIMISARSDLRPPAGQPGSPDVFIAKPFDIDNVLKKIAQQLNA